jgi:hypothetical protein
MSADVARLGSRFGVAAALAVIAFDVVQLLQIAGALRFPWDEVLIYGTSFCIVVPFVLAMVALHHTTPPERRFWTHAALIFTTIYAVFVTANYAVQLATVVPAKMNGAGDAIRLLEQTPHSMFWDYDAVGYIAMGLVSLLVVPAMDHGGVEGRARAALWANAAVTPVIAAVYFAPSFSTGLLLLGLPWAVTAPLFMFMLARVMRARAGAGA